MTRIPSKEEILTWISANPTLTSKRDIAKAFGLKGAARIELKRLLRELADEGHISKQRKSYRDPGNLPPVTVLEVVIDESGDLWGKPMEWEGDGPEPIIALLARAGDPALGAGDRILGKISRDGGAYTARVIRKIGKSPRRILGIFRAGDEAGRIEPIDKGASLEWIVPRGADGGAKDGELVEAEQAGPKGRMGLPRARITDRLGDPGAPKAVSLIAIHQHGIPNHFPDRVITEAQNTVPASLEGREDLRHLPFVTIDPSDARDHDDACFVQPDADTPGGHILWVAIADVAHYVRPGTALDREARKRGNSTYFPDRVVPMLPDRLSGDLCSLHEGAERAVVAVRMVVAPDGTKTSHKFYRAMIKSHASLSYEEAQEAHDGQPSPRAAALLAEVIEPLYDCYESLSLAREARQPLALDLPERRIILDKMGKVVSVAERERLDAHRLIEEFMVLANVAAAQSLVKHRTPLLFRVHEEPSPEKLDALREVAIASGLQLAKGQVLQTRHLNQLLAQARGGDAAELINISTLRSMSQAYYSAENYGHFGLSLANYAHFTSPIRRYADVIVHRALVSAHGWGDEGLDSHQIEDLEATAKHISETERRSMLAERDTSDRYLAAFLSERLGEVIPGKISGIANFGIFAKLDGSGADALIPLRTLGGEYFHYDRDNSTLMGADSGTTIELGQTVEVRLTEAAPVTGGISGELVTLNGKELPRSSTRGRGRGRPPKRKPAAMKRKAAAAGKKIKRDRVRRR